MSVSIPSSVLAAGWIPFVVVIVLILLIATVFVKYYNSRRDSEISSTLSAIFALSITLMTTALIPVDVFLVSYMKNSDGSFKDWAQDNATRASVEQSLLIGYYTMYGLVTFCMFILLPFMYFYYEEREEEATCKTRVCGAFKYTLVFFILVLILLLIGALVHTKKVPTNSNSTEWQKLESIFDMESNWLENSLSLVISILSLLGMLALFTYTAYGMAILPIDLIRGSRGVKDEKLSVQDRKKETRDSINKIRSKYGGGRKITRRDAARIENLEENEALMNRQERHLEARDTCCQKMLIILRPFAIVFGILLIMVALLVFLSLLLTNIDKTMHSLGPKLGYALPKAILPNPIDIVLVFCQQVFPLDYILFSAIVCYLIFSSMSGLRHIGIWFFCLRMYKIRPRRTYPQGMMMGCVILMLINLAINVILYELTPQYSSYGSQHYTVTDGNSTTTKHLCSTEQKEDVCVITRMSLLLTRFFYKMWFFGAAYYWGTWAFLLFIVIGFVVAIFKKRASSIDGEVDADDIVDSDEELLTG